MQSKLILWIIGLTVISTNASAYIGPGLGAGVIGTILGVIGAILLALFAVLYYPIKRALKKRRGDSKVNSEPEN